MSRVTFDKNHPVHPTQRRIKLEVSQTQSAKECMTEWENDKQNDMVEDEASPLGYAQL